jgi:hypothetical protein
MFIRYAIGSTPARWSFGPGATPSSFLHPFQRPAIPSAVTKWSPINHIFFLESELYFGRSRLSVLGFQYRRTRTNRRRPAVRISQDSNRRSGRRSTR